MNFLILIVLLLFLFGIAIFYKLAIVQVKFNTNQNKLDFLFYWLYPMLKAKVVMENFHPKLTIYLFKKQIYSKIIKPKKDSKQLALTYYKFLVLKNSNVKIYYGLNNPFLTGISSGIIQIIQTYFNNIPITHIPDFVPTNEYITLKANTKINIGKTLANIVRSKVS